jgi:hypothetical protein
MAANLMPVSEIPPEFDEESPKLAWQLESGPYIDDEQIGVHVPRLHGLLRVAGFNGLIVSEYQDSAETQPDNLGIAGINDDGTASAAGSAAQSRAAIERSFLHYPEAGGLQKSYVHPTLKVEINRSELASQGSDLIQRGLSREQSWSRLLDGSIRHGIRHASIVNMVQEVARDEEILASGVTNFGAGLSATLAGYEIAEYQTPIIAAGYALSYAALVAHEARFNKENTGSTHLSERNWGVLPLMMQPDRIALAGVMSAVPRLVRHIPHEG